MSKKRITVQGNFNFAEILSESYRLARWVLAGTMLGFAQISF